tara:strand:+ start:10 stop:1254 length:1245 start_codon:yes stop_codon:yes gene_type:complete
MDEVLNRNLFKQRYTELQNKKQSNGGGLMSIKKFNVGGFNDGSGIIDILGVNEDGEDTAGEDTTEDTTPEKKAAAPSNLSFTDKEKMAYMIAPIAAALLQTKKEPGQTNLSGLFGGLGRGLAQVPNTALAIKKIEATKKKDNETFTPLTSTQIKAFENAGVMLDPKKAYQISNLSNKISPIGGTGVTVNTGDKETAEQKEIGKGLGKQFVGIMEKADLAANDQGNLDVIAELADKADLTTGTLGPISLTAQKAAQSLGFAPDFQNAPAGELLQSIGGKVALNDLQKFKGAMSDKELTFVRDINPGLSMTKEGIKVLVGLKKRGNDLAIKYAGEAQEWVQSNGGLGKKNKDGKTWAQSTKEFNETNPLVNPSQREALKELSGRTPDAGFKLPQVTKDGITYEKIGNTWVKKTGSK